MSLLGKDAEKDALVRAFVNTCKEWKFDGLVIEIWSQLAGRVKYSTLVDMIKQVGMKVLLLIYAGYFNRQILTRLMRICQ